MYDSASRLFSNPLLIIDSRYAQVLQNDAGPYLPLDEENGQAIESIGLHFLLRLPRLLQTPEPSYDEIKTEYSRLKTEWAFTRTRYQYISNIGKIAGVNKNSLRQTRILLGTTHTIVLGIALILGAYLSAMDPADCSLQQDALNNGREVIQMSQELLTQLHNGIGFTPVSLFASWIATDDPEITFSIFQMVREQDCYWADPDYMKHAKILKERVIQIRSMARAATYMQPGGLQDWHLFTMLTPESGSQLSGNGYQNLLFSG